MYQISQACSRLLPRCLYPESIRPVRRPNRKRRRTPGILPPGPRCRSPGRRHSWFPMSSSSTPARFVFLPERLPGTIPPAVPVLPEEISKAPHLFQRLCLLQQLQNVLLRVPVAVFPRLYSFRVDSVLLPEFPPGSLIGVLSPIPRASPVTPRVATEFIISVGI